MSVFVKCLRRCRQNSVSATHDFHSQESVILIFSLDLVYTNKLCEWACMCFKDVRKYVDDCAVCRCVYVCVCVCVRVCVCVWTHTCVSFHQHFSVQYKALSVQVSTSHVLNDMPWSLLSHLFTSATLYRHTPPRAPPVNQPSVCDVTGRYLTRCRNQSVFHCYGQWSRQSSQSPLLDGRGQMSAS